MSSRLSKNSLVRVIGESRFKGREGVIDRLGKAPLPYHVAFVVGGFVDDAWFSKKELELLPPVKTAEQMEEEYSHDFSVLDASLKAGQVAYYSVSQGVLEYVLRYECDELAYRTNMPYRMMIAYTDGNKETTIISSNIYQTLEEVDKHEPYNLLKFTLKERGSV